MSTDLGIYHAYYEFLEPLSAFGGNPLVENRVMEYFTASFIDEERIKGDFVMRVKICILFILITPVVGHAATIHVPGTYPQIQDAIDAARDGDVILVDPGTYWKIDFLGKDVIVQSTAGPSVTVIDGNSNACGIVRFVNYEGPGAVLDGFTVTGGVIDGGIHCSHSTPLIKNNIIYWNGSESRGGGIRSEFSSPLIMNNVIQRNYAQWYGADDCFGGGMYFEGSASSVSRPVLINNIIFDNNSDRGGGIYFYNSEGELINNTLFDNSADLEGGGIAGGGAPVYIKNTIVWGNNAPSHPEIYVAGSSEWDIRYSDVAGGWPGEGNIDADPLWANPAPGDFHLTWLSPCINRGTNEDAPSEDYEGDARPWQGTADMGADEFIGMHPLEADLFLLHETVGGTVHFDLNAAQINAFRDYLVLGSISGSAPGIPLPGGLAVLPMNWDLFTKVVIDNLNTSVFSGFLGTLDAGGSASAALQTPGPIPGTAGITMTFAYALNGPWDFASNPIQVAVVP